MIYTPLLRVRFRNGSTAPWQSVSGSGERPLLRPGEAVVCSEEPCAGSRRDCWEWDSSSGSRPLPRLEGQLVYWKELSTSLKGARSSVPGMLGEIGTWIRSKTEPYSKEPVRNSGKCPCSELGISGGSGISIARRKRNSSLKPYENGG